MQLRGNKLIGWQILCFLLFILLFFATSDRNADVKSAYDIGHSNCLYDFIRNSTKSDLNGTRIINVSIGK